MFRDLYKPWYTQRAIAAKKKEAYLKYNSTNTLESKENYVRGRNWANRRIRQLKEEYWEHFTRTMESYLYGAQKKMWKMSRNRKRETND